MLKEKRQPIFQKEFSKPRKNQGLSQEEESPANLSKKVRKVTLVTNVGSLVTTSRIAQ